MTDGEKDWHACAIACAKASTVAIAEGDAETGREYRRMALAAALHALGEGWHTIRTKLVVNLSDREMLWLSRWTC